MVAIASEITSLTIVYSTVYSGSDQRKHQSSASLLCAGNSPVTGEFPAQKASNAENVNIWWRHHDLNQCRPRPLTSNGVTRPHELTEYNYVTYESNIWSVKITPNPVGRSLRALTLNKESNQCNSVPLKLFLFMLAYIPQLFSFTRYVVWRNIIHRTPLAMNFL